MSSADEESSVPDSVRPSLVKLTEDLDTERNRLLAGFESRRAVLQWAQRLTVRTMGRLPTQWYTDLAEQFRGVTDSDKERVLLSVLLTEQRRTRELHPDAVEGVRERMAGVIMRQAHHRAFRYLRVDANEYTDAEESAHDPAKQRYIAMRPALDELDEKQGATLTQLLDGFRTRESIIRWGDDLDLATHGQVSEEFLTRCYSEDSTVENLLCADHTAAERGRELFAASYLLPAYHAGVRDLTGFSGESADEEGEGGLSRDDVPMG